MSEQADYDRERGEAQSDAISPPCADGEGETPGSDTQQQPAESRRTGKTRERRSHAVAVM